MKTIECRRCSKKVEVEDNYQLKTCPICVELDRKDSAIRSALTERDRDAENLIKRLGIQKLPQALESYANFCEWFESRGMPKPSMEIYFKELTNYRKMEIHKQADNATDQIRGKNKERRKYNMQFLDFDLYPPTSREHCKIYRLSIMEGKRDPRLEEHLYECEECKQWQNAFDNGTLNAQYSSEIWHRETDAEDIANLSPCKNEDCKTFRLMYSDRIDRTNDFPFLAQRHVNCCSKWIVAYRLLIGEIKKPETFEEWEEQQGWKQCCSNCGTVLVNGKCPDCQPNT